MSNPKAYLGDSVYAEYDGCGVILTTENGYGPTNTIVLEHETLRALHAQYGLWRQFQSDTNLPRPMPITVAPAVPAVWREDYEKP